MGKALNDVNVTGPHVSDIGAQMYSKANDSLTYKTDQNFEFAEQKFVHPKLTLVIIPV